MKDNDSRYDLENLHTIACKFYEDGEGSNDLELFNHSEALAKIGASFNFGPSLNLLGILLSNKLVDSKLADQVKEIEEVFLAAIALDSSDAAYNLALFYKDIGHLEESKKRLQEARAMKHPFALEENDNFETINDNDPIL